MPWQEMSRMSMREEFVALALAEGANISLLCRRFGISRKTGYKWMGRAKRDPGSPEWAADRSSKPASCPHRTADDVESALVELRRQHPAWGARKLLVVLARQGGEAAARLPAPSTAQTILKRHGLVAPEEGAKRQTFIRFEHESPNDLWQMDFKGPVATAANGGRGRCHPLTIVDDHSRYALGVVALGDETGPTTKPALIEVFRRYGLPLRMVLDNGSCWGRVEAMYTAFTAWLLRLGVRVTFARPYHPQTRGKNERFNRTLKAEALTGRQYKDLGECQRIFDSFRSTYNQVRPHDSLAMDVPASRYRPSSRSYPEALAPLEYLEDDVVRKVGPAGYISWGDERYQVGRAFTGEQVALRPTITDGVWEVYFFYQRVAVINRRDKGCTQT